MKLFDLFDVPLGYVDPELIPDDDDIDLSPIPPGAYDHPGKWLALHAAEILAIADSSEELETRFADRVHEVSFFHVPTATVFAR